MQAAHTQQTAGWARITIVPPAVRVHNSWGQADPRLRAHARQHQETCTHEHAHWQHYETCTHEHAHCPFQRAGAVRHQQSR
eukprot:5715003-Prymnesium_polylepis.1